MRIPKVIQEYEEAKEQNTTHGIEDGFSYHFDANELRAIAIFLRRNQSSLPEALTSFQSLLEKKIYDSMTISEVMSFYGQK